MTKACNWVIGQLIVLFIRNGESCLAPKGVDGGYQQFIPHPKFEQRDVRRKCRMGDNILNESGMLECIWPGGVSNRWLDTFQHHDGHSDHCLIDMFSHTILLWSVHIGLLMNNSMVCEILDEVIWEYLPLPSVQKTFNLWPVCHSDSTKVFEGFKGIALLLNGINGDESGIVVNECDKISVPLVGYSLDLTDIREDASKDILRSGKCFLWDWRLGMTWPFTFLTINWCIPFTIPLHIILKIELMEMCLRCTCQVSIEAEAVVMHTTCAASTPWSSPLCLVMYACSMPMMVHGNLNSPLEKWAMPISSSLGLRISHLFSVNRTLALTLVRCVMDNKFIPIWGQWRTSLMMVHWWSVPRWILISIWPWPMAWITCLSPR